ncbi:MAG: desulfoferrodoxin [bacterium]
MTTKNQIYKCMVCGNITEVLHVGVGELVCCGQPMTLQSEKINDEGQEKHLPVVESMPQDVCRGGDGYIVKIGADAHPMDEDHHIEWVEIKTKGGKVGKRYLQPDEKPETEFHTREDVLQFRAYCNVHGLWKKAVK